MNVNTIKFKFNFFVTITTFFKKIKNFDPKKAFV